MISTGVKAADDVISAIVGPLTAGRSVASSDNNTGLPLMRTGKNQDHGGFATLPKGQIDPGATDVFGDAPVDAGPPRSPAWLGRGQHRQRPLHPCHPWGGAMSTREPIIRQLETYVLIAEEEVDQAPHGTEAEVLTDVSRLLTEAMELLRWLPTSSTLAGSLIWTDEETW